MPHPKMVRLLGGRVAKRKRKEPTHTTNATVATNAPLAEEASTATGVPGPVTGHVGSTESVATGLTRFKGWLFLFPDNSSTRTGASQSLSIRFVPEALLPVEATVWRNTYASEGRIVIGPGLPTSIASKIGALFDVGETYRPPRVVSCVIDATRPDAATFMLATESDSEAGAPEGDEDEDSDDSDVDEDDEENPRWG